MTTKYQIVLHYTADNQRIDYMMRNWWMLGRFLTKNS